jgi:ABC-type dipeptide/oligopeptide/nickel transport systems, permease components
MASLRYILERILHALPVLLGVTIFVFFAIQLVPGDPSAS